MPETDVDAPSVVVALDGSRSDLEVRAIVQQFLSALAWVRDGGLQETFSIVSGHAARGVGKAPAIASTINDAVVEYLPSPSDPKAKLGLALYREARSVNVTPYEFLGYFKIINVIRDGGNAQKRWIREALPKLSDAEAKRRVAEIAQIEQDVAEYLYGSGRCAIAHAHSEPIVNPDDPEDLLRLGEDLPVMKALARYALEHELGVQSQETVWQEHLFELEGFRRMFGEATVEKLKSGEGLRDEDLVFPEKLSVRIRDQEQLASFSGLRSHARIMGEGIVGLRLRHEELPLSVYMLLVFREERLSLEYPRAVRIEDGGTRTAARLRLDYLKFLEKWLMNGVVEVLDSQTGEMFGRTAPLVLVNAHPDWNWFNGQRRALQKRLERDDPS